ncbi:MAG: ABC transporter ATP-binding protein [Candidatus Cyclobacteriaceae bacterium M3_2C_046]
MKDILKIESVSKYFSTSEGPLEILKDISFSVKEQSGISIIGPSGSGKTTLLGLCAGLDLPSQGKIILNDIDLTRLNEDDRAYVRNQFVGFVFQNYQLLPTLSALDNVMIPLELRGEKNIIAQAKELLGRVGLGNRMKHYPSQLSGGEQQRVAIARAFISKPKVLFADEPTGNLDEETADSVTNLLLQINKEQGTTLVMVTHNIALAEQTKRLLKLKGGQLVEDQQLV